MVEYDCEAEGEDAYYPTSDRTRYYESGYQLVRCEDEGGVELMCRVTVKGYEGRYCHGKRGSSKVYDQEFKV